MAMMTCVLVPDSRTDTCLASPLPHLSIPGSLCTFKQELVKLPDLDLNLRSSCLSFPGSWDDRPVPSGTSFSAHPFLLYWSACERTHVCVHVERSAASILLNHLLLWVCRCVSVWAYVHTFVCVRMWAGPCVRGKARGGSQASCSITSAIPLTFCDDLSGTRSSLVQLTGTVGVHH